MGNSEVDVQGQEGGSRVRRGLSLCAGPSFSSSRALPAQPASPLPSAGKPLGAVVWTTPLPPGPLYHLERCPNICSCSGTLFLTSSSGDVTELKWTDEFRNIPFAWILGVRLDINLSTSNRISRILRLQKLSLCGGRSGRKMRVVSKLPGK